MSITAKDRRRIACLPIAVDEVVVDDITPRWEAALDVVDAAEECNFWTTTNPKHVSANKDTAQGLVEALAAFKEVADD